MTLFFRLARISVALCALLLATLGREARAEYSPAITVQSARSVIGVRFRFAADGPVRGGFALAAHRLLFGTEAGSFYAVDAGNGRLLWSRGIGSPMLSTPLIVNDRAYITTRDNKLRAYDTASGKELWQRQLGLTLSANDYWDYYVSSPIFSEGRLYVGSGDGRLYAVEPGTGRLLWSVDIGSPIRTTPVIDGNRIVVGTMSGHVVAIDRCARTQLWRFATQGAAHDFAFKKNDTRSVVTTPIIVGDVVIAGGRDGNIYGIDLKTGVERWHETHDGGSWILGLASEGPTFFSGSGSAFIMQAADVTTGKELWRTPTGNAMFGGIAKAGDVLVANGSNGNLFGFDARSGVQLWRFHLPDTALSSPLVAAGVVYTGADDGSVFAIDTSTGAAPRFDRFVFAFTDEPAASFFSFTREALEGIRGRFLTSGYAPLGNSELAKALTEPMNDRRRKIIVLADTRLPADVDARRLRRFLDGGGMLVLIGPDPLVYSFDSTGAPVDVDPSREKVAFGLDAPEKERDSGYNVSNFTPRARPLGLTGSFVALGWTRPDQVSTVLATDRSGMATAWVKQFANGGLLIDLPLPRNRTIEPSPYVNAIDLAASRAAMNNL